MKAADISDQAVFDYVRSCRPRWGNWMDLCDVVLEGKFPAKVVHAKVRQMINKGRLDGCPCGCRGDLEIPGEPRQQV